MLRQLFAYRNLLFLLMLLSSGCIFLTDDKKAGLPYIRELYLMGILGSTALLFACWKRIYSSKTALWILFMGVVLPVSSAVLAKLNWGQPIIYGLLEERRSFSYLVFFPTLFLLFKTNPSMEQVERFVLYVALICATIGFMYYLKIIPENAAVSFQVDAKEVGENAVLLRPDRYRIGGAFVSLSAFMLMYQMKERVSLNKLLLLLFFAAYLWLVIQTRQTMVVWALAAVWIFRNRIDSLLKLGLLAGMILVLSYIVMPDFYVAQFEKFQALLEEATGGPGVRDVTISISMRAVAENMYIGLGALSLQWNGGFSSVYNPHFYLSDVGIVGVYYRFGFLTPFIALIFYAGYLRIMKRCKDKGPLLLAFQLSFWFGMFNMVLSNALTYGGDTLGFATALFLYYSKVSAAERSINRSREWVNYGAVQYRHN
ncbi:hypothetical protein [Pseudomonas matsuisoli]|uniref:Uncharacterized protein n=1 Tax=Pseudomonas matsuisoli TaxID=1515666 RepID=A0A917UXI5_9PSED|nr:hypothetical protein [Pseudomonas matsuisoli]GGJ93160.1 hypothetical protein GCM10009304_18790 [Pseudomonas matsuisoli]